MKILSKLAALLGLGSTAAAPRRTIHSWNVPMMPEPLQDRDQRTPEQRAIIARRRELGKIARASRRVNMRKSRGMVPA